MTPVMRQLLVALSSQLAAMAVGGSVSFPSQLLQQLKSNESSIHLDINTSSWIGSIYGLAGIPVLCIPMLMQWKGRKLAHMLTCSFVIIGWALALTPNSTVMILASEAFQGFGTNSLMQVSFLAMTEMLAPKYRFMCMQIFSLILTVGLALVGISGRFIHTKTISLIMLVPSVMALVLSLMWPESPSWLACKGKFNKCERAFIWLRGVDDASKTELKELIAAQKENLTNCIRNKEQFWKKISRRDFYLPTLHMFVLLNMLYGSGGDVVLVYFMDMIEKSSHNQDAVYYAGIVFYAIIVCGCIITNITTRYFKNKTVLLSSTSGVIVSLICACIVTYLQSIEMLAKDSLLCVYCLIGFISFNSLGLNGLGFCIAAELMPVKHRSLGGSLFIIMNCGLYALTLKISPYLIEYIGLWGTFLIFTINAVICAAYVWKYVPETKGRTLQELEDFYTYGKFFKRKTHNDSMSLSETN